jgi:hypothetical protein
MSTANLSATGSHIVKVWCHAPGDSIALNDTLQTTVISYSSRALPVTENFETGPAVFGNLNLQVNNLGSVDVTNAAAKSGAYGFVMSGTFDRTAGGWTGGANNTTAIQAWANTDYHANAGFCVNAQSLSPGAPLEMFFDLRQTYSTGSTYSWMRVLINGVQFSPDFQPITQNSDPWERHRIDLSLFSGTSFEVTFQTANRFSLQFGLTDPGDNAFLDNIVIREPLPLDAGSLSLLAPSSDCGLDTAETVTLDIKNYGTQSISGFQVSYKLDNNPVVTETVSDTLAANAVLAYSFATKANLSAVGTHVLTLYTSLNGDGDANNDTIVITINNKPIIDTFPYSVDFENNSSGAFSIEPGEENNALISSTAANGSNLGFAMYGFNVNTTFTWNAATTFNTIVTNTTLNKRTGKIIACVDATNATSLELLFDLRQRFTFANNYSFLRVRVNGVTIQDVNMDSLYQPNTSNADPFRNLKFDLSSFAGTKFNLELQGFMKYSAGIVLGNQTFTDGDAVHIDNILLREKLPVDAGVIAISSPVAKCGLGATEDVVIDIKNFGISPLANVSASYSVNGATAITETVTPPQPIAAGATYTYTFTAKANLATAGVYNIKSWTSAINDGDNSNDTTSVTVSSTAAIAAFPYLENFETFTNSTNATGFANGWTTIPQNTTVLYRWNPDSGGTPTGGSGPNVDHTLGNATGKYLFTEASNPGGGQPALQEGDKAYVYSPCIDITTLTKPQLSFWYHMFGSQGGVVQMGNLYVLIEEGGVTTTVDSIIGQQQASNAAAWLNRTIDLSAFAGKTIRVVFMASRGSGVLSDMAIDDVGIDNAPAIDMAATEVVSPGNGCFTANQDVVIRVKNQGAQIINFGFNNATIQTNITGVNPQNFTTIVNTGSLQPGATQDIVVATGYNMLAAGNYIINSSIVVLGDANAANNAIRATTFTQTTSGTTPQLVDFETFNGNNLATINAGWREATGATAPTGNTSAWRRSLTAHNTFYGDWNAIVTMFGNARNEWIVSPKIIPGSFDTLSFDLAVTDYLQGNTGSINKDLMGSDDSLNVMITTDCGLTWQLVRAITRANNIDSTFTTFKISMAPYGGKQISLGFYATTGSVVDPEQYELHLDQINISKATGTLSSFVLLTPANNSSAYIDGAPTNNLTATWQNAVSSFGSTDTVRYEFLLDVQGGNFSFPLLQAPADNAGAATQINIPYPAIANLLKTGGLNVGDSITLSWTVKAIPDSRVDTQWAAQPFNLTLKRGVITGLDALSDIEEYSVYPNPANGQVNIVYGLKARTNLNIAIYNTLGEKVMESTFNGVQNGVAQLNSLELPAGLYHIKMMTNNSTVTKKIVVQH